MNHATGIPPDAVRYGPGVYITPAGEMHVDLDEMVRGTGGNPRNPADRVIALRAVKRIAAENGMELEERD